MLDREKILSSIRQMPEHFTAEELLDRIRLLIKIERGLEQVRNGNLIPDEEVDEKLKKWLK